MLSFRDQLSDCGGGLWPQRVVVNDDQLGSIMRLLFQIDSSSPLLLWLLLTFCQSHHICIQINVYKMIAGKIIVQRVLSI